MSVPCECSTESDFDVLDMLEGMALPDTDLLCTPEGTALPDADASTEWETSSKGSSVTPGTTWADVKLDEEEAEGEDEDEWEEALCGGLNPLLFECPFAHDPVLERVLNGAVHAAVSGVEDGFVEDGYGAFSSAISIDRSGAAPRAATHTQPSGGQNFAGAPCAYIPAALRPRGTRTLYPELPPDSVKSMRVPEFLVNHSKLNEQIERALPTAYNFEVHKILWRVLRANWGLDGDAETASETASTAAAGAGDDRNPLKMKSKTGRTSGSHGGNFIHHVGLQMPDGLIAWAPSLAAIVENFTGVRATVLADVNYGACCIDDLTAQSLGVDLLVHFGHSCLIPTDQVAVQTMYVFVDIKINVGHLVETLVENLFKSDSAEESDARKPTLDFPNPFGRSRLASRIALLGTVQFGPSMQQATAALERSVPGLTLQRSQARPLGSGEVLGCTAPGLPSSVDEVVFVCDGRFHLEAAMMRNPAVRFYLYNPYSRAFTLEKYDFGAMLEQRGAAVAAVRRMLLRRDDEEEGEDLEEFFSTVSMLRENNPAKTRKALQEVTVGSDSEFASSSDRASSSVGAIAASSGDEAAENPLRSAHSSTDTVCGGFGLQRNASSRGARRRVSGRGKSVAHSCYPGAEVLVDRNTSATARRVPRGAASAMGSLYPDAARHQYRELFTLMGPPCTEGNDAEREEKPVRAGLILGTLGRQGSVAVLERLLKQFRLMGQVEHYVFLLSEVSPDSLRLFEKSIDFWVQIACPRLSIDWGAQFSKPCLTTYEIQSVFADCGVTLLLGGNGARQCGTGGPGGGCGATDCGTGGCVPAAPAPTADYASSNGAGLEQEIDTRERVEVWGEVQTDVRMARDAKEDAILRWVSNVRRQNIAGTEGDALLDIETIFRTQAARVRGRSVKDSDRNNARKMAKYWPEMDYYANDGRNWANYGSSTGTKFAHMRK